jgi:hypothetical protein
MKLGPAHLQVAYGWRDEPILNERFRAWHASFQSCPLQWLDFIALTRVCAFGIGGYGSVPLNVRAVAGPTVQQSAQLSVRV